MARTFIIIPTYKPDVAIMSGFIRELKSEFGDIIIVDDGSGEEYKSFFSQFEQDGITVLRHYINYGKGRAIKTAFNYCLNEYEDLFGAVTADCDGQHSIADIRKCVEALEKSPQKLIIGTRNFDEKQVPFKSRYGNKITRNMFRLFVGIEITDTQSGLRAFSKQTMTEFLSVAGERYEYETNMLIACKERDIKISEVLIETIYINKNETSHFNPVKDSVMIYTLFIKYILSSVSSFLADILLFMLFLKILPDIHFGIITSIVISTVLARVCSSLYNFKINQKLVFKNKGKNAILKYFVLVAVQMLVSAFAVSELFGLLKTDAALLKLLVDTVIFLINFVIQREWVFKG